MGVTYPYAINLTGVITGYYLDANRAGHGFLRFPNGQFATFEVPGAGTRVLQGTYAFAINETSSVVGYSCDSANRCPGFVRERTGKIKTFDAPGDINGTFPSGINAEGAITGSFLDASLLFHGFVRSESGQITQFDAPDINTGQLYGTTPSDITPSGTVSGCYFDTNLGSHGFVRDDHGRLKIFDVPGSLGTIWCSNYVVDNTYPVYGFAGEGLGTNAVGAIAGSYEELIPGNSFGGNFHGFLRAPNGTITTFDAGASPSPSCNPGCTWTFGVAINLAGSIAGFTNDEHSVNHGFIRAGNGTIRTLDAPGAGNGFNQGTVANAIN